MSRANQEIGIQLGSGVNKLAANIEALDSTVENYLEVLEEYIDDNMPREELESSIDQVINDFTDVFSSQEWLGETTGDIVERQIEDSYEKFTAYRGLVHAAHQISKEDAPENITLRGSGSKSPVENEYEIILKTWKEFKEIYEDVAEIEGIAKNVSLQEGTEEKGLEPYAFDAPLSVLETDYSRITDLNACINSSYH